MRGISFWFFATGTIYVLIGMAWGIHMGVSNDHSLAPAHAHLNLVGWVTMALFGIYYHLTPTAAETMLAKIHFVIATLGLFIFVPGIVVALKQQNEVFAKTGSILTIISMLIFVFTVFKNRIKST